MALALSVSQVNYLNICLMLLSAVLAYLFPFELFLFVYAVLGPLHYLTEISWLHDKNYYLPGKKDFLWWLGLSVLITALFLGWIPLAPKGTIEFLTALAFLTALFFVILKGRGLRWAMVPLGTFLLFLFVRAPGFQVFFGIFLPTLIHVFIFTGMFILIGALKGRSFSGTASLAAFAIIACAFIFYHPAHAGYLASEYVRSSYGYLKENGTGSSPFIQINLYIAQALKFSGLGSVPRTGTEFVNGVNQFLYQDPTALALMSFIAFAYAYHYFNWFSKTSIIGWNEISRKRGTAILILWGASLVLYSFDFSIGLKWLFFLSFTHVLLEFPLNHLTFIGLLRESRLFPLSRGGAAGGK